MAALHGNTSVVNYFGFHLAGISMTRITFHSTYIERNWSVGKALSFCLTQKLYANSGYAQVLNFRVLKSLLRFKRHHQ